MARKDEALSHGDRPSSQSHGSGDRNKKSDSGDATGNNESAYGGSPSPKASEESDKR